MEIILSIAAGLMALRVSFKYFFQDWETFSECIRHWFTPEIIAIFRGEWDHNLWAELKIFFWLLLGFASGYGVHQFLIS